MLDHVIIEVSDIKKLKEFYVEVLKQLRYTIFMEFDDIIGFSVDDKPDFWLRTGIKTSPHVHVAFRALNRDVVDQFHTAALAAGAKDNGAPGIREHYHPNYYAAYVLDPEGHNIEVVCQDAAESTAKAPEILMVNQRQLKAGKSYEDFRDAWLPPVDNSADKTSLASYFHGPVKIFNAAAIDDPTHIITVAIVSGSLEHIQQEAERVAASEALRSKKMRKVADKTADTRLYKIMNVDELGK